jgi:hypothetical protein
VAVDDAAFRREGREVRVTTAQSIFVVYGVVILAYGFMLGVALATYRMKAPRAPQHLVTTHLSAIIQGAVHLGLAFAIGFADLGTGWAVAAAWLLVAGSSFEIVGGTINWLSGTGDQFAEKSLGFRFNSLVGPPAIIGIVIVAVGVLRAL